MFTLVSEYDPIATRILLMIIFHLFLSTVSSPAASQHVGQTEREADGEADLSGEKERDQGSRDERRDGRRVRHAGGGETAQGAARGSGTETQQEEEEADGAEEEEAAETERTPVKSRRSQLFHLIFYFILFTFQPSSLPDFFLGRVKCVILKGPKNVNLKKYCCVECTFICCICYNIKPLV